MAIIRQPFLFSWDDIEGRSDMERFELVRDNLPDEAIVNELEKRRGSGRNDFPVLPMWNSLIAAIVFQHESIESLIRELSRNPSLLQACGFDPTPIQEKPTLSPDANGESSDAGVIPFTVGTARYQVPNSWNYSRFLANVIDLEENQGMISAMTKTLTEQYMEALPNFGQHLGFDGKAIDSHSTGRKDKHTGQTSDPDADWGRHETVCTDKNGKMYTKIKQWFGYGLHLIADTHYEIPVAFEVTPASASEHVELRKLLHETFEENPALADRCSDFSADRGLDSAETKQTLWDDYNIRPIIDIRLLWREEKNAPDYDPSVPITRPLFPERADTIVHTERGTIHCVCPETGEIRDMAFQGFEADRNTLKYRCPAAAYGFECAGAEACSKLGGVNPGDYGRVVRIKILNQDRRIFTPTPYDSPTWDRIYNCRSSLERINSRLDNSFGFEKHFIRGKAKMKARVGLAIAVMMAMALGHVKEGRLNQMRSLVRPIKSAA